MYRSENPIIHQIGLAMQPIALLVLRLYIASVFLKSGLHKVTNWDVTLPLFENQYAVPFLPPNIVAILGSGTEILLSVFLILGVFSRWSAIFLFIFNIVAITSNAALSKGFWGLTTIFDVIPTGVIFPTKGYEDHVIWGIMIFVIFACGAGKISLGGLLSLRSAPVQSGYY